MREQLERHGEDPQAQRVVLVDHNGAQIKVYEAFRQFGRIEHDGRWFRARRMNESQIPAHVYVEEVPK